MKAGRNDPCPCGSGKKYKKCCMEKDLASEREQKTRIIEAPQANEKKRYNLVDNAFDLEDIDYEEFDDFDEDEEDDEEWLDQQLPLFEEKQPAQEPKNKPKTKARSKPQKQAKDIDIEAAERRWKEFKAANYEGKIAIYYKTLDEKKLMDEEMAFEMLSNIYDDAIKRNQRDRFDEMVVKLKKELPDVYEGDAGFYLNYRITNAIVAQRHDDVAALLNELSPLAGEHIDTFNDVESMLAYHGYLSPLTQAMKTGWEYVEGSPDIVPWGIDEFAERAANYFTFDFIETHPRINAKDPELLKNIKYFIAELDVSLYAKFVDAIAGEVKNQWMLEDFVLKKHLKTQDSNQKVTKKQVTQNLYYLTLEFIYYLREQKQVPYTKGNMAQQQLFDYILERQKRKLVPQPGMLEKVLYPDKNKPKKQAPPKHILCPDATTLDVFFGRLMNIINPQYYKLAATIELIPAWLRFLKSNNLIEESMQIETEKDIRSQLIPTTRNIFLKYSMDPILWQNIERSWKM